MIAGGSAIRLKGEEEEKKEEEGAGAERELSCWHGGCRDVFAACLAFHFLLLTVCWLIYSTTFLC